MKIRHILVAAAVVIFFFYAVDFVGKQLDKEFSCYETAAGNTCK